jgi:hypothetical protein
LIELLANATLTEATGMGGEATVSVAVPVWPSLVAVICAVPAATAVTRPEPATVATPVLVELQLITRPVRTLLLASRVVAVACVVCPGFNEPAARVTETLATGTGGAETTVSVALAVWPSLVAAICAVPTATAVTKPEPETVAMLLLLVLQLIERPVRTLLLASRVVAVA